MAEHTFLKEWKKENISMIKLVHPEWDEDKIEKCLNKIIDDEIKKISDIVQESNVME